MQNHLFGQNQLVLMDKQCAPIQAKNIITAFKQLLNIIKGNINIPRKPTTSRRLHPTCSHKTSSPRACQICHHTHKSPFSSTELNLLADTASDGKTSFHTMLQMITKQGCKSLPVKIDPGAEINTIPLSKYKKLFPAHFMKSGNLKSKALHPTTCKWTAHDMTPQKFLGYFIADIQHKTLPDVLQVRFFIFKDNTLPKILLSYAASIRLGTIEFKVPNKAPSVALDAITEARKHITFSTPLHSYVHKHQHNNPPLKPAIKLYSFQDHHFPDYSSKKTKSFQDHFPQEALFQQFSSQNSHSKTIYHQNHHTSSVLQNINHSRTILCKICHPVIVFHKINYFRTICHQKCHPSSILLKINHFTTDNVHDIIALKQAFPQSFNRVGSLPVTYTIHTDLSIPPVQYTHHKVLVEYKDPIEKALQEMVDLGIITSVTEPTEWVSSLTYPCKPNGSLCICLDPRDLNKAIIREHCKAPTLEEISHKLSGATVFSKLDAKDGFWSIHLDTPSLYLTTFNTHKGWYRFLCMSFWLKMSQDVFQMHMDQIADRLPGIIAIHDNICVYGKTQNNMTNTYYNLWKLQENKV